MTCKCKKGQRGWRGKRFECTEEGEIRTIDPSKPVVGRATNPDYKTVPRDVFTRSSETGTEPKKAS